MARQRQAAELFSMGRGHQDLGCLVNLSELLLLARTNHNLQQLIDFASQQNTGEKVSTAR